MIHLARRVFGPLAVVLFFVLSVSTTQAHVATGSPQSARLSELQSVAIPASAEDQERMHRVRRIVNQDLAITASQQYQEYVQSGCMRELATENHMLLTGHAELQMLYQQNPSVYRGEVAGFASIGDCALIMHFPEGLTPLQKCVITAHEITHLVLRDNVPNADPGDMYHSLDSGHLMYGQPRYWQDFVASYQPCLRVDESQYPRVLTNMQILRLTMHERGLKVKACRTAIEDGLAPADLFYCLSRDGKVLRIRILSTSMYDGDPPNVGVKQAIRAATIWDINRKNGGKLVTDRSRTVKTKR